ncbi:Tautomerase enzyme [Polynucleobacter meluiroseus]|uniref:Tautomerase enzyme n=1 Tax=Polynucleobacter meluiroseus TaxID=1938814 RepID=A0A240DXI6_9BURK|nr:tautomerase family protein [Polynucleobacter meluiroseus]SNX27703.1 Tautomerase enzyme [Polynucleobacter meluiroseus]
MPFVRIDLSNNHPDGFAQIVGDTVYEVMRTCINVPEDDKFQVITEHDSGDLVFPLSYLGIRYTADIIFIQVTLNIGRTTEMKKLFYKAVCDSLVKKLQVRPQDIIINLVEVQKENWSFGNGEMQYAPSE